VGGEKYGASVDHRAWKDNQPQTRNGVYLQLEGEDAISGPCTHSKPQLADLVLKEEELREAQTARQSLRLEEGGD
jgi:hypothetical protein